MGLVDIHFHESDIDLSWSLGGGEETEHPATEPPVHTEDVESGGPSPVALAVVSVVLAVVAAGVAVTVKKTLGGSGGDTDEDEDDLSVQ